MNSTTEATDRKIDMPLSYSRGTLPWNRKRGYAPAATADTVGTAIVGPSVSVWLATGPTYLSDTRKFPWLAGGVAKTTRAW
jgi:hypothetical protein